MFPHRFSLNHFANDLSVLDNVYNCKLIEVALGKPLIINAHLKEK